MNFFKKHFVKNDVGFTLMETLAYLFILSILLVIITGLVSNIFTARRHVKAADIISSNSRFILNFMLNHIHNADDIDPVAGDEQYHFYNSTSTRFSFLWDGTDLIYQETHDDGGGFPEQSSATPLSLNPSYLDVTDWQMTLIMDEASTTEGIKIDFSLRTNDQSQPENFIEKSFSSFISIR